MHNLHQKVVELTNRDTPMKGSLSGLGHFLTIEDSLKMVKNAFYVTSKLLFALKIFKFLSWFFGHIARRLL